MKSGMVASYESLQENKVTDVAVIGAGISGALTAYYLTKAGIDTVLVDKRHAGMGSTAASTALLQYEIDTPLHVLKKMIGEKPAIKSYELCRQAIYDLKDICHELDPNMHFNMRPSLQYASYRMHRDDLYAEYNARREAGFDINWLDAKEVNELYKIDAPGAILSAEAAEIDAYLLTHALLKYCRRKGQKICDNTEVLKIEYPDNAVVLHTNTGYTIQAKKLVIACGYESLQYIPKEVAQIQSTYALVSEPVDEKYIWYGRSLIWETKKPYMYYRVTEDNRILIGGKDDPFYNPTLRDKRVQAKAQALIADFSKKMPHIPIRIDFSWGGAFASTEDGLPYIGMIEQRPNTYFSLGFGGNGITFSVIGAAIIKDAIAGRKNNNAMLFSFDR